MADFLTTIGITEIDRGNADAACSKLREALGIFELLNLPGAAMQVREGLQRTRNLIADHCGSLQ